MPAELPNLSDGNMNILLLLWLLFFFFLLFVLFFNSSIMLFSFSVGLYANCLLPLTDIRSEESFQYTKVPPWKSELYLSFTHFGNPTLSFSSCARKGLKWHVSPEYFHHLVRLKADTQKRIFACG